jgi:hypothetical protein
MKPQTSRVGFRSAAAGPGRRALASRLASILLVGAGLAAIGLWLSSHLGAPVGAESLVSRFARESFAPGFGVASAVILVSVWTSMSRRVGDVRGLAAAQMTVATQPPRPATARRADASMAAAIRPSTFHDVRQAQSPRPELRSETGPRGASWTGMRASTGLRYASVATSELRPPMRATVR